MVVMDEWFARVSNGVMHVCACVCVSVCVLCVCDQCNLSLFHVVILEML